MANSDDEMADNDYGGTPCPPPSYHQMTATELQQRAMEQMAMKPGGMYPVNSGMLGSAMQNIWGQTAKMYTDNADAYGYSTTTATTGWNGYDPVGILKQAVQSISKKIHFYRINKLVEVGEGEEVKDPVDRLRIKAARWLNGGAYAAA